MRNQLFTFIIFCIYYLKALPEFFNIQANSIHSNREAYPLRPELIESVMYILRATSNDQAFLEMAVDYLESIEMISKINCGFATVKAIIDHKLEDRMESFFLAETLKYLYLSFDTDNFLHNDISSNSFRRIKNKYGECLIETGFFIFNTEAHPVDGASLECCRTLRSQTLNQNDLEMEVYDFLNIDKLLDRFVRLSNKNKYAYDKRESSDAYWNKTMKEEYEELRDNMQQEFQMNNLKFKQFCQSLFSNNNGSSTTSPSQMQTNTFDLLHEKAIHSRNYPFTCSLNNTFRLSTTYLNSLNNFP